MPQVISYRGFFISPLFNVVLLNQVIPIAENIFNSLPRKSAKYIDVIINPALKCLDITLTTYTPITSENYLRSCQYFSKVLSGLPGMNSYIVGGRLLVQ